MTVPRGGERRPVAPDDFHLVLVEPARTPDTGQCATGAPSQRERI